MKIAKRNPTHREWVVDDQSEFVKWSCAFLEHKKKPLRTRSYVRSDGSIYEYQVRRFIQEIAVIQWMYKLGRDLRVLRLPFDDFKYQVGEKGFPTYGRRWRWRRGYGGGWIGAGYFRGPRSYVRNVDHKPKELSETEQARRDWREKKHFKLDKAEGGWRRHKPKDKWVKKMCNRGYRRFEKLRIKNQDYEALEKFKPKDWFDPWIWD